MSHFSGQVLSPGTTPTVAEIDHFFSDRVEVVAFCTITELNGDLYQEHLSIIDGMVSVDMSRDERRNIQVTIMDEGNLGYGPGQLWYDKIITPYRGVIMPNGLGWVTPLGEFMIDSIERPHFPDGQMAISGRDRVKLCKLSRFADTTTFGSTLKYADVIRTIATNAGITKFSFSTLSTTLGTARTFEKDTERWAAMLELATAVNHEIFMDKFGYLVFRPFVDPATAPISLSFVTGANSNLVSYNRKTNDTRLFNEVVVRGSGPDNGLVFARAVNSNPGSPTSTDEIGWRTMPAIENAVITTNGQAQAIADSILKVAALESYDVDMEALVAPWLEAGEAIEFIPTSFDPNEPTRFLLSSFQIPLDLGAMSVTGKRVHVIA